MTLQNFISYMSATSNAKVIIENYDHGKLLYNTEYINIVDYKDLPVFPKYYVEYFKIMDNVLTINIKEA